MSPLRPAAARLPLPLATAFTLVLTLALASSSACSSCRSRAKGASPTADALLARVPAQARGAVVVADVVELGKKTATLERLKLTTFAAQLLGSADATSLVRSLTSQLGVDPRSPESLQRIGVAPKGGLAAFGSEGGELGWIIPIADRKAFSSFVTDNARLRLGAEPAPAAAPSRGELVRFTRPDGGTALSLAFDEGFAFLTMGDGAGDLAALRPDASLAQLPALREARARLEGDGDVLAYAGDVTGGEDRGAGEAPRPPVVLSVSLSERGVTARIDLGRSAPVEGEERLTRVEAPDGIAKLPAEAFLVARLSTGEGGLKKAYAELMPGEVSERLERAGLDVQGEVVSNLKPGAVVALSLAKSARLFGGLPALDVRRTNPFRYIELSAIAQVKDPARARAALDKLVELAPRIAARVERQDFSGQTLYATTYAQGEGVSFALVGSTLLAAAPLERLRALVSSAGQRPAAAEAEADAGPIADASLREPLRAQAAAAVLDVRALAVAVEALPSEAWGVGGFAIRATALRWLEAVREIAAVSGGVRDRDGALQLELAVRFGAP